MAAVAEQSRVGEKLPPHDISSERALLGALLVDSSYLTQIAPILTLGDFVREEHQTIYRTILPLSQRGDPVDQRTVSYELERNQAFKTASDRGLLSLLVAGWVSPAMAPQYAALINRLSKQRQLLSLTQWIAQETYGTRLGPTNIIAGAQSVMTSLANKPQPQTPMLRRGLEVFLPFQPLENIWTRPGSAPGPSSIPCPRCW